MNGRKSYSRALEQGTLTDDDLKLFISVSCHKVAVNLAALGDDTLVFPEGKLMSKHQTLKNGFEYEVDKDIRLSERY